MRNWAKSAHKKGENSKSEDGHSSITRVQSLAENPIFSEGVLTLDKSDDQQGLQIDLM